MQHVTSTIGRSPLFKRVMAVLLLLSFLGIHAVASSSRLHKAIHHDAKSPNHDCVFVHVSACHCLGGTQTIAVPMPAAEFTVLAYGASLFIFSSRDYLLLPGRAPPVSLA
jgi:hypothetical protein